MSNLENLTSKILEDAKKKAEALIADAKLEEEKKISESVNKANVEKNQIIEKTKMEAKRKKERIFSSTSLDVRNKKLEVKQKMIDKVFQQSVERLTSMSNDKFLDFIKSSILSIDIEGDEMIILSQKFKDKVDFAFLDDLNKQLKAKGKKGNMKISSDNRKIAEGFIIAKNRIELNYTFSALVNSIREELEYEVAEVLFS